MRKEVLFAILAGGIFGLIIAFGIWRLNKTIGPKEDVTTEASPTPSQAGITIAKPNEKQVVTESSVEISGITKPNFSVVITGEDEDVIITSGSNGEFSTEIELVGGVNQIFITAFNEEGDLSEQKLTLIYSSEFAQYVESDENEEESEATESADDIQEKVQEKIKQAQKVGVAYMGTITDISEQTFQLKSENEEINQVSTDDSTSFVSTTGTKKSVEFEDVAIGDYLIAMGFRNGNGVLEAKRVLISSEPEEPLFEVSAGKITEIGKKEITLELFNGSSKTVLFGKNWKGPDLDELDEGQNLIVVETTSDGETLARTIQVMESEEESPSPTPTDEPTDSPTPTPSPTDSPAP